MAKRKPLGGGVSKAEQLGSLKGLSQAAGALDAPISPDSGDLRTLPIDEIRPDPDNPRLLNVTLEILSQDIATIDDVKLREDVEDIHGLATTIKSIGQRTPIEVVREGSIHRIVFGERRYWACQLAGLSTAKCMVLRAVPDNVPLVQLIENIQHKGLGLVETILNIRLVVQRESDLGSPVKDATDLIERTGLARASAYRYWRYIDLPKDVDEALEARVIGSHAELNELLKFETVKERKAALLRYIASGHWEVEETKTTTAVAKKSRGRPRAAISFGSTKNSSVAKALFELIDPDGSHSQINFEDPGEVTNAWKTLLAQLEERISNNG